MADRLSTTEEIAQYLGVPIQTIYQWNLRSSGPKGYKVGRHIRYRLADVDAWLESHSTAA